MLINYPHIRIMKIIFATNNVHKLEEIRHALSDTFELISLAEAGFSGEIPETGPTLESNALQKARFIFNLYGLPVFADDSGLEVECLNGLPGVDTAHYSGTRDALANMQKLLKAMANCKDRSAKFRTVIAYLSANEEQLFQGEVSGIISEQMRGSQGFGYDPVFIAEGHGETFAEMGIEAKSKINHRVRALQKFTSWLNAK
jgi:XTP/dITP diphosphohydrolase